MLGLLEYPLKKRRRKTLFYHLCVPFQQLSLCDGEELGLAGRGHTGISSIPQPPYPQMSNCYMKMQGAVYLRYSAQNLYSQWSHQWLREWELKVVLNQNSLKFIASESLLIFSSLCLSWRSSCGNKNSILARFRQSLRLQADTPESQFIRQDHARTATAALPFQG